MMLFQSTHPCRVRRNCTVCRNMAKAISIHAPVWGATGIDISPLVRVCISIHAPVWGATGESAVIRTEL